MKKTLIPLIALLTSCSHLHPTGHPKMERTVNATLWQQNSGEARALSYQAFNLARMVLDQDLQQATSNKHRAIVVDVDETVLDNSPYQAKIILTGQGYPTGWQQWVERAQAQALPGAVEFLQYAHTQGVRVFYITNRKDRGQARTATIKNLQDLGFPVAEERVILRNESSSKSFRRNRVMESHRIVLLMGDNLGDFAGVFDTSSQADRNRAVEQMKEKFGRQFIVLPNPMYGDWERALYQGQPYLPSSQQAKLRKQALRSF